MANLLFLVHRLPFPPNKGDKLRSYHLLRHLTARHRVFLGTFVDDPDDEVHVEAVREICPDLCVARLHPGVARVRSLAGLLAGEALSLHYYRDPHLQAWVRQTLREENIDVAVIFSSVMARYLEHLPGVGIPPMLVDFVDVDSSKWTEYSVSRRWPLSWLYKREGERLLSYERAVAARSQRSFFVTENETELFQKLAPECAKLVGSMSNGVDTDYFAPSTDRASPFAVAFSPSQHLPVVFTGAMDYWPNIDAVTWFVQEILPRLRRSWPALCFYIVGRSPPPSVSALACESVVVTGTVPDVRPYLQHAALVVAPLRVARGLQNKILEAMAMGRPVVASRACAQAIDAGSEELVCAAGVGGFVREIDALLRAPARAMAVGQGARRRVIERYGWAAHLGGIDRYLDPGEPAVEKR